MTFHRAIINGLLALVIGTILGSISTAILGTIQDRSGVLADAVILSIGSLYVAIPFVFLYGLPLYALLFRLRLANVISAVVLGAAPAVVPWWLDELIWQVVLMHGVAIAIVFHYLMVSRFAGGSSEPVDQRGNALNAKRTFGRLRRLIGR